MVGIESSDDRHTFLTPFGRVEFFWRDDRWVHALTPGVRCDGLPRVETVEGDPDRDNPARVVSPAYQQAHVETGPDGISRMLLVGQSGPHHFSAAFAIEADEAGATLDVDVADRCRSPIEALAATYQAGPTSAEFDGDPRSSFAWTLGGARLALEAGPHASLAVESAGYGPSLLTQVVAGLDPASHTHRLRYRWRWSSG